MTNDTKDLYRDKEGCIVDPEPAKTDRLVLDVPIYIGDGVEETLERIANPEGLPQSEINWKRYADRLCEWIDRNCNIVDKDGNLKKWRK